MKIEGKKTDVRFITASPDNKISLRIPNIKTEDKDLDAKVIIEKGLKPESGNTSTQEAIVNFLNIPSPFTLTI